jgi:dynamin 1-like protein
MESVLDKCLTPTQEMIVNLMEIENANINTNHPDFVGAADCLLNLFQDEANQAEEVSNTEHEEPQEKTYSLLSKRKQEPADAGQSRKTVDF